MLSPRGVPRRDYDVKVTGSCKSSFIFKGVIIFLWGRGGGGHIGNCEISVDIFFLKGRIK